MNNFNKQELTIEEIYNFSNKTDFLLIFDENIAGAPLTDFRDKYVLTSIGIPELLGHGKEDEEVNQTVKSHLKNNPKKPVVFVTRNGNDFKKNTSKFERSMSIKTPRTHLLIWIEDGVGDENIANGVVNALEKYKSENLLNYKNNVPAIIKLNTLTVDRKFNSKYRK